MRSANKKAPPRAGVKVIVKAHANIEKPNDAERNGKVAEGYNKGAAISEAESPRVVASTGNDTFRHGGGGFGPGDSMRAITSALSADRLAGDWERGTWRSRRGCRGTC